VVGRIAFLTVTRISRFVIAVVIPFSLSAILVTLANVFGFWSYPIILANLGKYAKIIGFGVLVIGITSLLWCKVTKAISEDKK
jgi:membrane protein DedA with SNARE-associated domain